VIIPRADVDELAQLAAELELDLEALATQLGIPLYPPSIGDACILWHRLQHVNPKPVEGLKPEERSGLDVYLCRFILTFEHEKSRQNRQRFEAFRQHPDRYGHLDLGATFQYAEYTAFEHGLDLLKLSTQVGMNLCNLTRGEVRDLRRRVQSGLDEALSWVSEAECRGLESFLRQYEEVYERRTRTQSPKRPSRAGARN
jgi:hypothetical protein